MSGTCPGVREAGEALLLCESEEEVVRSVLSGSQEVEVALAVSSAL